MLSRVDGLRAIPLQGVEGPGSTGGFDKALQEALENEALTFSKHARERMQASNKEIGPLEKGRLEEAVQRASSKGCRESLVLGSDMAYIVNVPSRTVVTAISADRLRENVFTQIDSAVIL